MQMSILEDEWRAVRERAPGLAPAVDSAPSTDSAPVAGLAPAGGLAPAVEPAR
jgi:hypothetical protein